jgi:hypothetical protein
LSADQLYDEKGLLERITKGDEQAFAQLFDRYWSQVYSHVRSYVKIPLRPKIFHRTSFSGYGSIAVSYPGCRLLSPIDGVYDIPDGSRRFLLTRTVLADIVQKNRLSFLEPLKTVNVNDIRCMSTVVFMRKKLYL